jgi:ATP-dependent Lon protease
MSLNLRKRPSNILDDNIISKRPRIEEKNPIQPSIPQEVNKKNLLNELTPRNGDNDDLPQENVLPQEDEEPDEEPEEESGEESEEESEEYSGESSDEYDIDYNEEMDILKDKDPDLHSTLKQVHEELEKTEPSVHSLLKTPLRIEDRAKLCQFYEIYKSTEPNTLEWLDARTRYNTMFKEYQMGYKQYEKFTPDEHKRMKEEEKKLTSYNPQLTIKYKILNLQTSQANKAAIYRRYEDLQALEGSSDEYIKLKHWLTWATSVPHDKIKRVNVPDITQFIIDASHKLDKELFGMKKVKEQILLFLSAKLTNPSLRRGNLGLKGPPGTGKTQIARMVAKLMNWGFEQISFGGVDKADFLKGHEYTYVGAQPGAIIKALRRMGHKNGVIFLDELEKAAEHPDVRAALLHLVDQSQNHEFRDNFLGDITTDLSHIWYIASMNSTPRDQALADRWWMIEVPGYTLSEKIQIVKEYLLPKALKSISRDTKDVTIDISTCEYLIQRVCKKEDKGVRTIQKSIMDIINKISFLVTHQDSKGRLPFSTTFKMHKKLSYPIELTKDILDKLVSNKELNVMLNMMYL